MTTDRPEDAEDWPLRDWSARLRPPSGSDPAATEAEILYEDEEAVGDEEAVEGEEAVEDEDVPEENEVELEEEPELVVEVAGDEDEPETEAPAEPDHQSSPPRESFACPTATRSSRASRPAPAARSRSSSAASTARSRTGCSSPRSTSSITRALPQQSILVMPVPGAFELPIAAMALAKTRRYACIVALGCVIRGETPHFDFVASEAASGLQLAGIETGVPVSFGLLTTDTPEQADARVDKGAEAARTALEMADAFQQLRTTLAAARTQ